MKKHTLTSIIVLTCICLVVTVLLATINSVTAPVIKKNQDKANSAAYADILPGATNLVEVEGNFPETVTKMMKDEGGAGYVFEATTKGYTGSPIMLLVSVDALGNIVKFDITNPSYPESKGTAEEFEALYVGKALPPSDFISGGTVSSNAYKAALNDIFTVFCEYAGVEKSDEQKLADLYSTIMPNGTDKSGTHTFAAIELPEGVASSITAVYAPVSKTGYIVLAKSGDTALAAGVNAYGKVFYLSDLDGNDKLADTAFATVITDIETTLPSIYETNNDDIIAKMIAKGIIASANDAENVDFGAVSNDVVAVYKVSGGYAYVAKSEGFGDVLEVCYVIGADGSIVKYATLYQKEVAYEALYGTVIDTEDYAKNLDGKAVTEITDDTLLIAGSTFTTKATTKAWNSVKAAHEIMNGEAE